MNPLKGLSIASMLDYRNSLLYGVSEYQIRKLQEVLNAMAWLVYCAPKYCNITPVLRELHWLPVRLRIDFKILHISFKIPQGLAPSYLKTLVSTLPASHYQLRRNDSGIWLASPRFRTKKTIGDRAFMVAAPVLWSSLPLSVRLARKVNIFKRLVKTYLLSKAFC